MGEWESVRLQSEILPVRIRLAALCLLGTVDDCTYLVSRIHRGFESHRRLWYNVPMTGCSVMEAYDFRIVEENVRFIPSGLYNRI